MERTVLIMTLLEFFDAVRNASYGFPELVEMLRDLYYRIWADYNITELFNGMWWHLRYIKPFVPIILLILYGAICGAGKRCFPVIRFTSFFIFGLIFGVYSLSPIVLDVLPELPTWIIGAVTGVVAGVLSKILYFVFLAVVSGYSTYILCYQGLIPGISSMTKNNWLVGLICAVIVIVAVIFLLKHIEMIGTSLLGGFGMATVIRGWYDYTTIEMFVGREWLGVLLLTLVFAVIGYIIQFKTRERYN